MKNIFAAYTLCALFSICHAQSPGGIKGQTLWLRQKSENTSNAASANFNFNPVLSKDFTGFYKDKIRESYSLFIVFKSDIDTETPVLELSKSNSKITVTNKFLRSDNDVEYKKVDSRKGILLSYISSIPGGKKHNGINIEDFYGDPEGNNKLMEVIYYPRVLQDAERRRVETYLSVKYGLSLLGNADYLNSSGGKIWDYKKNSAYNTRVTSIGRDDASGLNQKQSGNALHDGIYVGLDKIKEANKSNSGSFLRDTTFLVWGDNAGSAVFIKNKDLPYIEVIKRIWKLQQPVSPGDNLITQLRVNKKEMGFEPFEKGQSLWLATNSDAIIFDYNNARFIQATSEDKDFVYFDNIKWDEDRSGADLFTLVKGPDLLFSQQVVSDCSQPVPGGLQLTVSGGLPPYTISIMSASYTKECESSDTNYTVNALKPGRYTVKVTDSNSVSITKEGIELTDLETGFVSLEPVWAMAGSGIMVKPVMAGPADSVACKWGDGITVLSTAKEFYATKPGNYTLTITTPSGCEKELPFIVSTGTTASGWAVYPNPAKSSQPFKIEFNLDKDADVTLSITSLEGKQCLYKQLGTIKNYTYTESLLTSGVYMVTITINGTPQTAKLIIE